MKCRARAVLKVCCTATLTVFIQMEAVTVFCLFCTMFNLLNVVFYAALNYHIVHPARGQGKRIVAGMIQKPLKSALAFSIGRIMCLSF